MERAAKLVTLLSMLAAVALAGWFVSGKWAFVWPVTIAAFVITFGIALFAGETAAALVMAFAYVFPAAIILTYGRFYSEYAVIWMAALLGALIPRSACAGWSVPAPWRAPLILWALTIAVAWPIVVLREIDFGSAALSEPRLASSISGGFPHEAAIGVLNTAATLGIGILWFDWLFLTFGLDAARFRRWIPGALAVSWLVAVGVAAYQLFGDLRFLATGIFATMGRATSTMGDANAFGMVAAVSGAIGIAWLLSRGDTRHWWLVIATVVLSWIGLWASASRTAFVAGVIVLVSLVWSGRPRSRHEPIVSRAGLIAVVAAVVVLIGFGSVIRLPAIGPVERLRQSLPRPTIESVSAFAKEMWNRNNYGAVATIMIREHPLVGVGPGSFYILLPDYSSAVGSPFLIPRDNAQNWYRHQLAEFGLLGSIGWISWTLMFGWFVLVAATSPHERLSFGVLKGALVALALVSLVGMPTQNTAVAMTLWTLAYWLSALGVPGKTAPPNSAVLGKRIWAGILVVLCLFIGGTVYAAQHELRVAHRAARADWRYAYGFYPAERAPDGREFRWAKQRAVVVLPATTPWMRLTVSVNHSDLASQPVEVRVWCDERIVVSTTLHTPAPITEYVRLPSGDPRFVLETWVSRTFRPQSFGGTDPRELGLMVEWDFVDGPPSRGGGSP